MLACSRTISAPSCAAPLVEAARVGRRAPPASPSPRARGLRSGNAACAAYRCRPAAPAARRASRERARSRGAGVGIVGVGADRCSLVVELSLVGEHLIAFRAHRHGLRFRARSCVAALSSSARSGSATRRCRKRSRAMSCSCTISGASNSSALTSRTHGRRVVCGVVRGRGVRRVRHGHRRRGGRRHGSAVRPAWSPAWSPAS